MKNVAKVISVLAIPLVFLGGCSSQVYHDYVMSGQIADVDGKEVVVCVSDTDGLKTHDVFNVYRTVYDSGVTSEGESGYSRELVGKIRLGEKQDQHFAKAIVLSGDLIRYDMVELNKN